MGEEGGFVTDGGEGFEEGMVAGVIVEVGDLELEASGTVRGQQSLLNTVPNEWIDVVEKEEGSPGLGAAFEVEGGWIRLSEVREKGAMEREEVG